MKINSKEVAQLLRGKGTISGRFYLHVFDFSADKKSSEHEQYVLRWCLLVKNLLLTSKQEHGSLETVIVLEGHQATVCHSSNHGYGVKISFSNSDYHMYCSSRETALSWVGHLSRCGYMALYDEWQELQGQYNTLLAQQNRISKCWTGDMLLIPDVNSKEIVVSCELSLNCPTQHTFASVYAQHAENSSRWVLMYQTESVDHSRTPHYCKTFHVELSDTLTPSSPLKFCINNMNSGNAVVGYAVVSLAEIERGVNGSLCSPLRDDHGNPNVGSISLTSVRDSNTSHRSLLSIVERSPHLQLDSHRGFTFRTLRNPIYVSEQLWDHSASQEIPLAYVYFLLERKERILESFEEFTELDPIYDTLLSDMIGHYNRKIANLVQVRDFLASYEGPSYRKSVLKKEREWQFCPVNLAVYAVGVSEEPHLYFCTTVGAFSAHGLGYRASLRAALNGAQMELYYSAKYDKISTLTNRLYAIWEEIERARDKVVEVTALENIDIYDHAVVLTTKIADLMDFARAPEILMSVKLFEQAESIFQFSRLRERNWSFPEQNYVWDGEKYVERDERGAEGSISSDAGIHSTETEITMAITRFIGAVEGGKGVEIEMMRMLATLEPLVTQARQGLMFTLLLEENKIVNSYFNGYPDMEMRIISCFSQALAALVTVFNMSVTEAFTNGDRLFFQTLASAGYLVYFQSLLSTHSQEQAMLEDHWVSVLNLAHCSIVLSREPVGTVSMEGVSPIRLTLTLGVGDRVWSILPEELRSSPSSSSSSSPSSPSTSPAISIHPVLFTKGVNEQQLLAETMGSVTLQETINLNSLSRLQAFTAPWIASSPRVRTLFDTISHHVHEHVPRDVKVFAHLDELVRLVGGGRVTSCKSAKDRTAMAVTHEVTCQLERVHVLQDPAGALAALRSHGVRPLNCKKNTGCSKYAFNGLQLKVLPKEYRPPIGSYGGKIT